MRILLLTPVFPPAIGGIETLSGRLAQLLEGEVLVITREPGSGAAAPYAARHDGVGFRVVRVLNEPRGSQISMLRLNARALVAGAAFHPNVILSMHIRVSPTARALSRVCRVPYVQYVHAKEIRDRPALARFAVQGAAAVVGVSRYSRDLALEVGADPNRITIVPCGVDLPGERRVERDCAPTIVTVSRLEDRYKGHDVTLRALPVIRGAVPDVRWGIIGDGCLRSELKMAARRAGLSEIVSFLGWVDEATRDDWLERAWVLVMPSREPRGHRAGEGFGIVYLEAGAHGLPVVAGRVPGVVDSVIDGMTGLLVDSTNPGAVADAAVRILTDEELAGRLGAGGRKRAAQLQWPNIAARLQRLLEKVVATGGGTVD